MKRSIPIVALLLTQMSLSDVRTADAQVRASIRIGAPYHYCRPVRRVYVAPPPVVVYRPYWHRRYVRPGGVVVVAPGPRYYGYRHHYRW